MRHRLSSFLLAAVLSALAACAGTPAPSGGTDVDLTALSVTMAYAEAYNMTFTNPEDYVGKTVRVRGPYVTGYYDVTGLYYHFVVVEDVTVCCSLQLEFLWNGQHVYPEDYPAEMTIVELSGVFGSYEELGETYFYIAADELTWT